MIDQLAQLGYTDGQIAAEVGWTVPTVRKWRYKVQQQGRRGLASQMGRPVTGALGTYPALLRDTLRDWRVAHPGWGAKTMRAELEADERFAGQPLPGKSGIARFLREESLTRSYQRHSELPRSKLRGI